MEDGIDRNASFYNYNGIKVEVCLYVCIPIDSNDELIITYIKPKAVDIYKEKKHIVKIFTNVGDLYIENEYLNF